MESEYKNKEKKKILTISLLVSNRKDTIRKCMESIKPLLEALPSELIAVDTGCTDGSIEIVKEYADLIVSFPWCHDFAAARNAGLEKAQGEWFLYLDDDEWFEDVTEIIEFFQNGEYKQYNAAWYIVRNYLDIEGCSYKDAQVARVCRRTPGLHFIGKVHEVFSKGFSAVKLFSCYVHHYGYVFKNQNEQMKHTERNVSLLKIELENNPNDLRMLSQLIQEYRAAKRYKEAKELCEEILKKYSQDQFNNVFLQYIVTCLPTIARLEGNEDGTEQLVKRVLMEYPLSSLSILVCMAERVLVSDNVQNHEAVLEKLPAFFKAYDNVKAEGKRAKYQEIMDRAHYTSDEFYLHMIGTGFMAAFSLKRIDLMRKWLEKRLKWAEVEISSMALYGYAKILMKMYLENNDGTLMYDYYGRFLEYPQTKEQIYNDIEKLLLRAPEKRVELAEGFEALQRTEPVFVFLHLLYQLRHGSVENNKQAFQDYFSVSKRKFDVYVITFCLEQGKYINELLHYIDFVTFKEGVAVWQREWDKTKIVDLEQWENSWDKKYELYFAYVKMVLLEKKLSEEKNQITSTLVKYTEAVYAYACLYYAKFLLQEENWIMLPRDCRFALFVKKAFEAKEKGCRAEWTEYMKKAAKVQPSMIDTLQNVLREETKRVTEIQVSPEMQQLAAELKKNIRQLLAIGQKDAAKELILALEQYVSEDVEIEEWKAILFL